MSEAMVSIYVPNGSISVHAGTVERLDRWGRWSEGGGGSAGRCASVEGRYRRDPAKSFVSEEFELNEVLEVERIVCNKLPRIQREIIKRHFVLRQAVKTVAMSLCIHRSQYGRELRRSILMVKNNLTRGNMRG